MIEKLDYENDEDAEEEKENLLRENSQTSDETSTTYITEKIVSEKKCTTKGEIVVISAESYHKLTKRKKTYKITAVLDALFAMFLATPCVVACWRGIWMTMDLNSKYFPMYETYFFSIAIDICFILFRKTLILSFHKGSRTTCFIPFLKVAKYFYIYIFAVICNMKWRATWLIIDHYTNLEYNEYGMALKVTKFLAIGTTVCSCAIILLKLLKNTLAVPLFIALDDKTEELFDFPTRFKSDMTEKMSLYILDCLFSILVVGNLVVFVWKGCWVLLDNFVFPTNPILSTWGSLIIGYSAVALAFLLQSPMRMICDKLEGAPRLIVADLFLIFSLFGTINVWRGIWNLLNIYLLPDNLPLSCWISHSFSYLLLVLLGCSNSLLVRGVYIDAEEPAGKCVVFPCYYLRLIFQEERKKKLQNILQQSSYKQDNEFSSVNKSIAPLENNHFITLNTISEKVQKN